MPTYKNPFEKGRLFIHFSVDFPQNHFANAETLAKLERLLPPRPQRGPIPSTAEETVLEELDLDAAEFGSKPNCNNRNAYDEDTHAHGRSPHGAQCQAQ